MSTLSRGYSFGATEQVTNTKLHNLIDLGTVSNIVNADIDSAAAISDTKLDLASIAQTMQFNGATTVAATMTMSAAIFKPAKGADVASTAGTITLGDDGNQFDITGTAAITGITAKTAGTIVILQTDSTASFVDGGNLKLGSNFQGAAESTLMLYCDGTNWFEVSRSPETSLPAASQAQMEAATSNVVAVTPLVANYHPGVAKAWCIFSGTAVGTNNPIASYNVSSVTRSALGRYVVTFVTAFSSADTFVIAGCTFEGSASRPGGVSHESSAAASANKVGITTSTYFDGNAADFNRVYLVVYGDL